MTIDDYVGENGFFAENDTLLLRRLNIDDKEEFMRLTIDVSKAPDIYKDSSLYNHIWNDCLNGEDLTLSLVCKASGEFLGALMIKKLQDEIQEIGIDIVRDFRNRGLGFAAVSLLLKHAKECNNISRFYVRIYKNNIASRKLFSKFNITEIAHEDGEFIRAMKEIEKSLGKDYIAKERAKEPAVFAAAEDNYIILYELKV